MSTNTFPTPVSTSINFITEADKLAARRETFEKRVAERTKKGLYIILGNVYALYREAQKRDALNVTIEHMLVKLEAEGFRKQKNTVAASIFVRYVFGSSDRKRISVYAKALINAQNKEIPAADFADFIQAEGGVEKAKATTKSREAVAEAEDKKKQIAVAKDLVMQQLKAETAKATMSLGNTDISMDAETDFVFVIARKNVNNELELLQALPKTTKVMQDTALVMLAEQYLAVNASEVAETMRRELKITVSADQLQTAANDAFADALDSMQTISE